MDDFDCTCPTDPYTDTLTDEYTTTDSYAPAYDASDDTYVDLDGDGFVDTVIAEDPTTGAVAISMDTDGDGILDTMIVDSDGDLEADLVMIDSNGDGIVDSIESGDVLTDSYEDLTVNDFTDNEFDAESMTITDTPFEVVEETEELNEDIHGDPQALTEFHQAQPGPVDCLPTSVSMVLSQVTGETVPASDVVATANDLDLMNENGMAAEDSVKLFEEYGVDAEVSSGSLDDLRTALDNGDNVIIGLDSADLYNGDGGPFDETMQAGHAVEITGIDDEAGVVYINDPGFGDGAGVEIPIEVFEDAWEDSDNTMVTVTGDQAVEGDDENVGGWSSILLPLQFTVDAK